MPFGKPADYLTDAIIRLEIERMLRVKRGAPRTNEEQAYLTAQTNGVFSIVLRSVTGKDRRKPLDEFGPIIAAAIRSAGL